MIEVFKIIYNYYDTGASVKLNCNPVGSTRGNKFKLRKDMCRYDKGNITEIRIPLETSLC